MSMADGTARRDEDGKDSAGDGDDDLDLDLDEDELFNTANYREQRLEELKREYVPSPGFPTLETNQHRAEHSRDLREIDHGKYTEIFDEPEVIRTSA
jgi:hypothetical protein